MQRVGVAKQLSDIYRALMAHAEGFKPPQIREKLVKVGVKVLRHGRYIIFQLAELAPR